MRGAGLAEFVLRRTTGAEQAAAEVGDLLELAADRGQAWFWRAVLGSVARRSWRAWVAFAVAYWAYGEGSKALRAGCDISYFVHSHDLYRVYRVNMGVLLAGIGAVWTMIAVYSAIRFGTRDPTSIVARIMVAALWCYVWLVWFHWPWVGLGFLPALVFGLMYQGGRWRKPLYGLLAMPPMGMALMILWGILFSALVRAAGGGVFLREHPGVLWMLLLQPTVNALVLLIAFNRLRRFLLPENEVSNPECTTSSL